MINIHIIQINRLIVFLNPYRLIMLLFFLGGITVWAQQPKNDIDRDGISNSLDIDDDGDGLLDEVESINIARGKSATMSSLNPDGSYVAENVIDGNLETLANTGNTSSRAWIQVDLGAIYEISRIKIWNGRDSCCRNRLGNVYVLVSSTPFDSDFNPVNNFTLVDENTIFRHQLSAEEAGDPEIVVNTRGRYVRLQKSGNNPVDNSLNIAEIKVFKNIDTDNDGIPNHLDIDSDNDIIPDNVEAQSTLGFRESTGSDTDLDGLDDAYDPDNSGVLITPEDTDNDGVPDYLDKDSDNDTIPDREERFETNIRTPDDLPKISKRFTDKDYRYNNYGADNYFPYIVIASPNSGFIKISIRNSYSGIVQARIMSADFSEVLYLYEFNKQKYRLDYTHITSSWSGGEILVLKMGGVQKSIHLPSEFGFRYLKS